MKSVKVKPVFVKFGLAFIVVVIGAVVLLSNITGKTGQSVAQAEEPKSSWFVRCDEPKEGQEAPAEKHCEMFQRQNMSETGKRVLEFAIGFPKELEGKARGVVILPLGILLEAGAAVQIDEAAAYKFNIRYCDTGGCYAFIDMKDDVLKTFQKGKEAVVSVKLLNGKQLNIPMPLKGFSKAYQQISA